MRCAELHAVRQQEIRHVLRRDDTRRALLNLDVADDLALDAEPHDRAENVSMRDVRERILPYRLHDGDFPRGRAAKIFMLKDGTLALRPRIAAVERDGETFEVRRHDLGDFLPEGVEERRQAELLILHRLFCGID